MYPEEMTITPVQDRTGEITHFIAIKLDITERKRAEERICLLAQAVENSAELIAISDPDGRISFVNHALLLATGYKESELIGEFFGKMLISQNNPQHIDEEIEPVLSSVADGGVNVSVAARTIPTILYFSVLARLGIPKTVRSESLELDGTSRSTSGSKLS